MKALILSLQAEVFRSFRGVSIFRVPNVFPPAAKGKLHRAGHRQAGASVKIEGAPRVSAAAEAFRKSCTEFGKSIVS